MSVNPHYTPGMGYKNHQPTPKVAGKLEQVIAKVRCGEVELKLTLTPKFLARPLRDALVEPFLKAHNKRAARAVAWDELACIKVDGLTLDDMDVTTETVLKADSVTVALLTQESMPSTLLAGLMAVAREPGSPASPYSRPMPLLTKELVRIAQAAADSEEHDADLARRCSNAFQKVADGAEAISVKQARGAMLLDEYVRSLCFPEQSPHTAAIDAVVRRMATNGDVRCAASDEFAAFFAAISAMACAPPEAAEEEEEIDQSEMLSSGVRRTGNSMLDQLLDDENVTARRVA
jgi:hypothetical protein